MDIKVIGSGCPDCSRLYENTCRAVERLGLEARVEKVQDLMDIVRRGVMSAPSLMVDGVLVLSGRVAGVDQIAALLSAARD